jgi:UDP:flavonoid glycosyltransferase YjiC (YdhE family)
MLGALSHGLPQLIMPQGGDQFVNADACRQAGAALALAADEVTPAAVKVAAQRLLTEPEFAMAAHAVQREINAMPDAASVFAAITASEHPAVAAT